MRTLYITALAVTLASIHAHAAAVQPCTPGAANENIIGVSNGVTTYCVSDFGWSDTWLLGTPRTYSQTVDLLSGDDAFNLYYNAPPGGTGAGSGWLSPSLDQGTLKAQIIPSNWTVIQPVHATGPASAESVIGNADGLVITIDTTSVGSGVQLSLTIVNTSISTITGLELADYFDFHPNGSDPPGNQDGTTSYQNGCIVTTGIPGPNFLANGFMCGVRTPDNHEVGFDTGPTTVWNDVQNLSYLNNDGPIGPGATAGALEWNLGSLAPGAQVQFSVGKNNIPTDPIPEPGSIYLALAA